MKGSPKALLSPLNVPPDLPHHPQRRQPFLRSYCCFSTAQIRRSAPSTFCAVTVLCQHGTYKTIKGVTNALGADDERTRHIQDSQGQILALSLRFKTSKRFELFPISLKTFPPSLSIASMSPRMFRTTPRVAGRRPHIPQKASARYKAVEPSSGFNVIPRRVRLA